MKENTDFMDKLPIIRINMAEVNQVIIYFLDLLVKDKTFFDITYQKCVAFSLFC